MSARAHIVIIPDGNRRHARREHLTGILQRSRKDFREAVACLDSIDRKHLEARLHEYIDSGEDPGWGDRVDPLDQYRGFVPAQALEKSYRRSAELLDQMLHWATTTDNIGELTFYAAQAENLNRADIEVASFLSVGAEFAARWAQDDALCSRCSFHIVGDRRLFESKANEGKLERVVATYLENTARLAAKGLGSQLRVNILAAYHFEWEINQAIENGVFDDGRLIVSTPVDLVYRAGSQGRPALSGALPCQSAFSRFYFTNDYFPDNRSGPMKKAFSHVQPMQGSSGR